MKLTKILPWIIFVLVLGLAWMIMGGSGYADRPAAVYSARAWHRDYSGNDLGPMLSVDRQGCATACNTTKDCAGFVMNAGENMCWLKSAFKNPTASNDRHTFAKPGTVLPAPQVKAIGKPRVKAIGKPRGMGMDTPKASPRRICIDMM
jgi:PAN domain